MLYLAYCCFLVPARRLCFYRLRIHVRLDVSALRLVLFHVVGLLMLCFCLVGIPHPVLVVLSQKPPGVLRNLPIFPCSFRKSGLFAMFVRMKSI